MDKEFKLTTASYRLNPLVNQAKDARLPDHLGTCKSCGCPVSVYHGEKPIVIELRQSSSNHGWWAACDNADCEHAHGNQHPDYEEWVTI